MQQQAPWMWKDPRPRRARNYTPWPPAAAGRPGQAAILGAAQQGIAWVAAGAAALPTVALPALTRKERAAWARLDIGQQTKGLDC